MRSIARLVVGPLLLVSAYALLTVGVLCPGCTTSQLDTGSADLHATSAASAPVAADLTQIGATLPSAKGIDKTAAAVEQIGVATGKMGDAAQVLADSSRKSGSVDLTDPAVQKAISSAVVTAVQAAAPGQAPQVAAYSTAALGIAALFGALLKAHGTITTLATSPGPAPPPPGK